MPLLFSRCACKFHGADSKILKLKKFIRESPPANSCCAGGPSAFLWWWLAGHPCGDNEWEGERAHRAAQYIIFFSLYCGKNFKLVNWLIGHSFLPSTTEVYKMTCGSTLSALSHNFQVNHIFLHSSHFPSRTRPRRLLTSRVSLSRLIFFSTMEISELYNGIKVLAAELRYCWHCSALCYRGCRCYTCGADNWFDFSRHDFSLRYCFFMPWRSTLICFRSFLFIYIRLVISGQERMRRREKDYITV